MMTNEERRIIDQLFERLADVERKAPPREPEADAYIGRRIAAQPAAPYYMAQTVLMQERALEAAQARIAQLEQGQARRGGGFLSGLFGGGGRDYRQPYPPQQPQYAPPQGGPWGGGPAYGRGGGFLAGAAQTAMGVAGGMLMADMLGGLFGGHGGGGFGQGMTENVTEINNFYGDDAGTGTDAGGGLDNADYTDFGGGDFGGGQDV